MLAEAAAFLLAGFIVMIIARVKGSPETLPLSVRSQAIFGLALLALGVFVRVLFSDGSELVPEATGPVKVIATACMIVGCIWLFLLLFERLRRDWR